MVGSNWEEHARYAVGLLPPELNPHLFIAWTVCECNKYIAVGDYTLANRYKDDPANFVAYYVNEVCQESE